MEYKNLCGERVSALGMGTMRLPSLEQYTNINVEATREMTAYAIENGVNYFDTAWVYHGGNSEGVMGQVLSEHPRERFYLATKFPGFNLDNMARVEEIFEKQLERCRVDYFDFYLFHNLCESNVDAYLDPKYGIFDYLMKQKENGRIRHLGFSTHGSLATTERFLKAYRDGIEFGQIQLNWLDYTFQNAKAKLELLEKYDIPAIVMEPVRGGRLAKLDAEYEARLKALRPDESIPAWAFRFLQTLGRTGVTLSGMSNMEQLRENIAIHSTRRPLNEKEYEALMGIAAEMSSKTAIPCTKCQYCTPHCAMELDIPRIIEIYNEHANTGEGNIPLSAISDLAEGKKTTDCVGCRECESVCPQGIKISEMMADFTARIK